MSVMSIALLLVLLPPPISSLHAQDLRFAPCPYPRTFGAPCVPPEDEEAPSPEDGDGQPPAPPTVLFPRESVAKDTPELLLSIMNRPTFTFTDAELDQLIAQEAEKKRRMQAFQQALSQRLKERRGR